jgi:hypothetical protein
MCECGRYFGCYADFLTERWAGDVLDAHREHATAALVGNDKLMFPLEPSYADFPVPAYEPEPEDPELIKAIAERLDALVDRKP